MLTARSGREEGDGAGMMGNDGDGEEAGHAVCCSAAAACCYSFCAALARETLVQQLAWHHGRMHDSLTHHP